MCGKKEKKKEAFDKYSLKYKVSILKIAKIIQYISMKVCPVEMENMSKYFDYHISWSLDLPSWTWSYGSWIYSYLCNQCLSPTMCEFESLSGDTTLYHKASQWLTTGRSFSPGIPVSSINKKLPPQYNWNIVESGVKHHKPKPNHFLFPISKWYVLFKNCKNFLKWTFTS